MKRATASFSLLLSILTATLSSAQQIAEHQGKALSLLVENDTVAGTDKHYSSGFEVAWTYWNRNVTPTPFPIGPTEPQLPSFFLGGDYSLRSFAIGQKTYTPADLTRSDYIHGDRPYAGWSYLRLSRTRATDHQRNSIAIEVGSFGTDSQAGSLQRSFHELIGSTLPRGWEHQIKNQIAADLILQREDHLLSQRVAGDYRLKMSSFEKLTLGTANTRLQLGLAANFGKGPTAANRRSLRYFSRASTTLVGRDRTLSGPLADGLARVRKSSLVSELEIGVERLLRKSSIRLSLVRQGRSFEGQDRAHTYGSLRYSFW